MDEAESVAWKPNAYEEEAAPKATAQGQPSIHAGIRAVKRQEELAPLELGKQRLQNSHNYWVATTRPDGAPHVMVVWGLWLDGGFIFSTGRQSRKARNLVGNPKCVICNELAHEAVVVEGIARRVRERANSSRCTKPNTSGIYPF